MAIDQYLFSNIWHIDAVTSDGGNLNFFTQAARNASKGGSWHHGCDGRYGGLMPGKVSADNRGTSLLHFFGE